MPTREQRFYEEMGRAVSNIIAALNRYAYAYEKAYGTTIGEDAVIGDEGWLVIAKGVHRLLDGEIGHMDAGNVDHVIRMLVREAGFTEKEFDQA